MQLTYRGVSYQSTNTVIETKIGIAATYRGISYNLPRHITLAKKPQQNLVYRGAAYTTNTTQNENAPATPGIKLAIS